MKKKSKKIVEHWASSGNTIYYYIDGLDAGGAYFCHSVFSTERAKKIVEFLNKEIYTCDSDSEMINLVRLANRLQEEIDCIRFKVGSSVYSIQRNI